MEEKAKRPPEYAAYAEHVEKLTGTESVDGINSMTLVQQMESIGLFEEGAKFEEGAVAIFRPEERLEASESRPKFH